MSKFSPANVLVLAQNSETALELAQRIGDAAGQVWISPADVPASAEPDVVVTDLPNQNDVTSAIERCGAPAGDETKGPETYVVLGIGPANWARIHLPPDVSDRELQLACRLLGEIARLRAGQARAARLHRDATELANTDPLTGLANRRAWNRQLQSQLAAGQPGCWLAIIDLDRFKQVNDAHGLAAGDQILRRAAQRMAGVVRRGDLLARIGGDEFGLLLVNVERSVAIRVFERLGGSICDQHIDPASPLTASIGYASAEDFAGDAARLFSAAEGALREAKQAGGDRAVCARKDSTSSGS